MTNSKLLQLLRDELDSPSFFDYNIHSVNHILIATTGYHGAEERRLALKLLNQFLYWYTTKQNCYLPVTGDTQMYSKQFLSCLYRDLEAYNPTFDKKQSLKFLAHSLKKYQEIISAEEVVLT